MPIPLSITAIITSSSFSSALISISPFWWVNFIALLNPDKTKTTVLVFNGKGQFTGVLESTAKSEDIVKSVNKKTGGCKPGSCGSGKKC